MLSSSLPTFVSLVFAAAALVAALDSLSFAAVALDAASAALL